MSPPIVPPPKRGHYPTPFATWSRYCPLGRHFDRVDSDEEDAMDRALLYAVWEGRS